MSTSLLLNERELEILDCLVDGWLENDCLLPGDISYQDVIDFIKRLGMNGEKVKSHLTNMHEEYAKICEGVD